MANVIKLKLDSTLQAQDALVFTHILDDFHQRFAVTLKSK